MIRFAEVEIGRGGLPACRRCSRGSGQSLRGRDAVRADLEAVCASWRDGPGPNVLLTGTESFEHVELPELVEAAGRLGVERLGVQTAGRGLAENAAIALQSGVRLIEFVCVASDDRSEQILTGQLGRAAEGLAGIAQFDRTARALSLPATIVARLRVCAHNLGSLEHLVEAVTSAGATTVAIELAPSAHEEPFWADACAAAIDAGVTRAAWTFVDDPAAPERLGPLSAIAPATRFAAS